MIDGWTQERQNTEQEGLPTVPRQFSFTEGVEGLINTTGLGKINHEIKLFNFVLIWLRED